MKMTKIFAMAIAALTIVSCTNTEEIGGSDTGNGNDIGVEGINTPTYATFKFNIGGPRGRAAADFDPTQNPEADAADKKIGNLQLLIFNAGTQALEYNDVVKSGNSETVLLTAGRKKIFFVANSDKLITYKTAIAPATFKPGEKSLTDFYALHFNAGIPQQITANQGVTRSFKLADLHTLAGAEAGLPMSNTNEVTYTLAAGVSKDASATGTETTPGMSATNNFNIQLYYMIAKARLVLAGSVLSPGDAATKKPAISNVQYSIRNLARATNYIQNVPVSNSPQSYYYAGNFADKDAFDAEFDYASNIKVAATAAASDYLYVPENNHSMLLRGQTSYFAIKATFEPVVISAVEHDINTTVKYAYAKLADALPADLNYIYTTQDVEGIPAGTYFKDIKLLEAAAWIMANGASFVEATHRAAAEALVADPTETPAVAGDYISFKGGNSYYRVDIGSTTGADTQYGVLRSNKYDATINQITGPGVPSEEDLAASPTNPVSAKTYISATITTAVWKAITQSADL